MPAVAGASAETASTQTLNNADIEIGRSNAHSFSTPWV